MSFKMTAYRIFIASPGGLRDERKAFRKTIYEYNETDAIQRGVLFVPTGWEDTLAGAGRPQGIINQDLKSCDYFVLLVWDRWGTPPDVTGAARYTSGTEEEFHVAEQCLNDPNEPLLQMAILFKAVPDERLIDPGEQLKKVLSFSNQLEEEKRYFLKNLTIFHISRTYSGDIWLSGYEITNRNSLRSDRSSRNDENRKPSHH